MQCALRLRAGRQHTALNHMLKRRSRFAVSQCKGKLQSELNKAASDAMWHLQCACKACTNDILAAGALCPVCSNKIQSTIIVRY